MYPVRSYLYRFSDICGILLLICLISAVPFHFFMSKGSSISLYREFISSLFILLLVIKIIESEKFNFKIREEIFFLLLFPILLCFAVFYDPMVNLYQDKFGLGTVANTYSNVNPSVYILRNAVLYIPMTLYLALRGLSKKEIEIIAIATVIIAPFSIIAYLYSVFEEGNLSIFLLGDMAAYGGANISYNSYVPYLTFPFIAGLYILAIDSSILRKLLSLSSIAIMSIFIFLSSSRQSILFILFAGFIFLFFDKSKISKKIVFYSSIVLSIFILYYFVLADIDINERLTNKYESVGETSRIEILFKGMDLLRPHEFLTGAGLTSVLNSGPHNDFLRWTQRVGLIIMVISFVPYLISTYRSWIKIISEKDKPTMIFIMLTTAFTLYHSLFGYPREDAFQSLFCFLGLALYLGYHQKINRAL